MNQHTLPATSSPSAVHTPQSSRQLHGRGLHRAFRGLAFSLICLLFLSCDKTPANGLLDGLWQLTSIETPDARRSTRDSLVFLSIQLSLAQWNDRHYQRQYFSHFSRSADSLRFFDLAHTSQHSLENNYDEWITPAEIQAGILDPWGIHTIRPAFAIRTLDRSTLVLQNADTVLHFRKF